MSPRRGAFSLGSSKTGIQSSYPTWSLSGRYVVNTGAHVLVREMSFHNVPQVCHKRGL